MVTWKPQARMHLKKIYQHIAKDSTNIAKQVVNELTECTRQLNDFPFIGKIVPEINDDNLRELHAHSWRILYQVQQPDVYVIAVIHKRQMPAFDDIQQLKQ